MKMPEWIMNILKIYPAWAYRLECHVCGMTFVNAKAHYDEVAERHTKRDKYI